MNKETLKFDKHEDMQKYLYDTYPIIFQDKDKDMTQTCLCWGISVGLGWFDILNNLCERVQLIANTTGMQLVADQVKEKFGTLRFYFHIIKTPSCPCEDESTDETTRIWCDIIDDLVTQAEDKSDRTCEECGEYGKACGGSWIKTLCKKCASKSKQYQYEED